VKDEQPITICLGQFEGIIKNGEFMKHNQKLFDFVYGIIDKK